MDATDAELLAQWSAGRRQAGEQLVDRYFAAIARFFRNKLSGDVDTQDDLLQTTFASCLESASRFRGEGSFRSFLFSIAFNVLRRHYERGRRSERIDFGTVSVHDLAPGPSTMVAKRAEQALLLSSMRRLPLTLQTALELHYWESMTAAEIGEVLEIPVGTVKTRLRRAKTLLAGHVREARGDPEVTAAALAALEDE